MQDILHGALCAGLVAYIALSDQFGGCILGNSAKGKRSKTLIERNLDYADYRQYCQTTMEKP